MVTSGGLITFSEPERPGQGLVAVANIPNSTIWTENQRVRTSAQSYKIGGTNQKKQTSKSLHSHFPIPEEATWQTLQRAVGMAQGQVVDVLESSTMQVKGTLEVGGHHYCFEDKRPKKWRKFVPLSRFLKNRKEIRFTFWPTLTRRALECKDSQSPPIIYISHLRKQVLQSGLIEVIGQVQSIAENTFTMGFTSFLQDRKYYVEIQGRYPGKVGDLTQINAELRSGNIHFENHFPLSHKL